MNYIYNSINTNQKIMSSYEKARTQVPLEYWLANISECTICKKRIDNCVEDGGCCKDCLKKTKPK